jgi:hypothetical protein
MDLHKRDGNPAFCVVDDDDEVLQTLFNSIDSNQDGILSCDEIVSKFSDLKPSSMSKNLNLLEKFEDELQKFCRDKGSGSVDLKQFKEIAMKVPRIHGQRTQWALSLNLHSLLASKLLVGEFLDELSGIRSMTEMQLDTAITSFVNEAADIIKREWRLLKEHKVCPAGAAESALSKFAGPIGKFGDNGMFQEGLENQIGTPDPFILKGIIRDNVLADGSRNRSVTSNYRIVFSDLQEYARLLGNRLEYEYAADRGIKLTEQDVVGNIPIFLLEVAKGLHPGIQGPSEAELKDLADEFQMLRTVYGEVCSANCGTFPGDIGNFQQSMEVEFETHSAEAAIRFHDRLAQPAESTIPHIDIGDPPLTNRFSIVVVAPLSFFASRNHEKLLQSMAERVETPVKFVKMTRKGPNSTFVYCNIGSDGKPTDLEELLQRLDFQELSYLSELSSATCSKEDHIQCIIAALQTAATDTSGGKLSFIQGRRSLSLRDLMALDEVKRAGLRVEEAIQVHQFTGPIFQVSSEQRCQGFVSYIILNYK